MKRRQYFANTAPEPRSQSFLFANSFTPDDKGWVQISPFGDFWNVDKAGNKAIQRVDKNGAEAICNSFASPVRLITQPLGIPWYVGHPDHPRFKGQPGHTDQSAKGRGKELQVRHDASCKVCADFANSGVPCGDHGIFMRMKWNEEGEHLIANEAFHGHSVNWAMLPAEMESGVRVWRPTRIKSVGFTNEPGIPVKPASLANAEVDEDEEESEPTNKNTMQIPPWLKVLAGFKADEDVTEEQIQKALEKLFSEHKANKKANDDEAADRADFEKWLHELLGTDPAATPRADLKTKLQKHVENSNALEEVKKREAGVSAAHQKLDEAHKELRQKFANAEVQVAALETNFANERTAHAGVLADRAVREGRITMAQREAKVTELSGAGENFANVATALATAPVVVKVTAITANLGGQNTEMLANVQDRQSKWDALMRKREQEFANEYYDARYAAVAETTEGKSILAQMVQPTKTA